jgi:hypothetical protein
VSLPYFSENIFCDCLCSASTETFIDYKIPETALKKAVICHNCLNKLNLFDEHQTIANAIKGEFIKRHHGELTSSFVSIKLEPSYYPLVEHKDIVQVKIEESSDDYNDFSPWHDFSTNENLFFDQNEPGSGENKTTKRTRPKRNSAPAKRRTPKSNSNEPKAPARPRPEPSNEEILTKYQIHVIDGVRQFQCDICKSVHPLKSSMTLHLQTHRTERNFICDVRKFIFFSMLNLF